MIETWTIRAQVIKRLETSQMSFVRSFEGAALRDKNKINHQQNRQYHKERMALDRLPQSAYFINPFGRRDLGRTRKRWKDNEVIASERDSNDFKTSLYNAVPRLRTS
ncbi:hypothetical protein C0J52_18705 [Blattella germanica]|nr:hypothetical protein C0J52_18705 [Blattella germanica]